MAQIRRRVRFSRFPIIRICIFAAFLPISTTSCGTEPASPPIVTRTDSSGVSIVQNERPGPDFAVRTWTIAPEPSLTIGAVEGEESYQFFGIAGIHRFRDGRIGMVNAGSREVRIFGPDGKHIRTFGKRGEGPGEFEMPVLAGSLGDTLLVVDRAHHRLTFVHPDQGFVGLTRISDEVGGFLNPSGSFANGECVFGGAFDLRRVGELHNGMNRAGTYYRSASLDGSLAADFGDKDGAEFFIKDLEGEGQDARPALIPFAKIPVATVSPNYFFFSDQDAYEIEVYEPSGALVRIIRMDWDKITVTPTDGERHIESVIAQVGNPNEEAGIRAHLGSLPLAETFPPLGSLLGDSMDHLWVEDFQPPGAETRTWTIFDPEGAMVGRTTLPESFNPVEIGADYLLGIGWDEMNVEYVRMYHLDRGS